MPLKFADADDVELFTTGAAKYLRSAAILGEEGKERIAVAVQIGGQRTEAFLDTAATWSVCHPELATVMGLDRDTALMRDITYGIRGYDILGDLFRIDLSLLAQQGNSLPLEATVFVPGPPEHQELVAHRLPRSVLGFVGCLEWIRFAVDPFNDTFYFGGHP